MPFIFKIKFIIPDPPTSPYASAFPLILVILVTAIKQSYEDFLRHKEDWKVNSKKIRVLREGKFETIKWKNIKCGDIVEVLVDTPFPCDLLFLYSKTENGTCHVKTANLDGETNIKQRTIPKKMILFNSEDELAALRGVVSCEKPNARLYEFKGTIVINETI